MDISGPNTNGASSAPPVDLSHYYSKTTKNRSASRIKEFYKFFAIPGIGNLAGGMPHRNYFPYDTLEGSVAFPERFTPTPNQPVDPPSDLLSTTSLSNSTPPSSRVLVPKDSGTSNQLRKIDLTSALQYGTAQGYPPLYSFLRQFTRENLHPNVPYAGGPEIILTVGNTDGFAKTLDALTNTWNEDKDWLREREGVLVEKFCYMNAVQAARPRGLNIVPVAVDEQGMSAYAAGGLWDVLENWDLKKGKRPHILYTVTIGQNPTTGTLGVYRRKEIYDLCCKYDVVIVEDDPYWYLQYPSANGSSIAARGTPTTTRFGLPLKSQKSSGFAFLDSLVPSYLAVDTEGRVVRLDTFSKTVAPGCRMGWITTQPNLCERLLRITETSTQQPSGFVQSMIAELIMGPQSDQDGGRGGGLSGQGWKVDGWVRWLEGLRGEYERRMNAMCSILEEGRYLVKSGRRQSMSNEWSVVDKLCMYDFPWPLGGMFVWVKVNYQAHPLFNKVEPEKLAHALWVHLTTKPYLVLVSPGAIFAPTEEIANESGWKFFRLCFAAVEAKDVEMYSHGFVEGIKSFWGKKNLDDIEELTKAVPNVEGVQNLGFGGC